LRYVGLQVAGVISLNLFALCRTAGCWSYFSEFIFP
jgi:hypothetical protein